MPHHSDTAMWHDDNLTRGNILIFKKNQKIKKKNKNKIKKIIKKIQKIEELTRDTPSNSVNLDLTEMTNLRRFNKKKGPI